MEESQKRFQSEKQHFILLKDTLQSPEETKKNALSPDLPHKQKPLEFQLVGAEHEPFHDDCVVLRGRCMDGTSVAVRATGYHWSMFLQRYRSFDNIGNNNDSNQNKKNNDVKQKEELQAAFLARFFKAQGEHSNLTVPKVDNPQEEENIFIRDPQAEKFQPISWSDASNTCRTIYGWTPPEDRLQNLLRVYFKNPRAMRNIVNFVDSNEFIENCPEDAPVRCFGGSFSDPMQQFRLDCGITMGAWVRVVHYGTELPKDTIIHADKHYFVSWENIHNIPDVIENAPLRVLSFDIECAGKKDPITGNSRFPVAAWDAEALRRYLHDTYNIKRSQLPKRCKNTDDANDIRHWFDDFVVSPWQIAKEAWLRRGDDSTRKTQQTVNGGVATNAHNTGTSLLERIMVSSERGRQQHQKQQPASLRVNGGGIVKKARCVGRSRITQTKNEIKKKKVLEAKRIAGTGLVPFRPKQQHAKPVLPDEDDTDPTFMIVCVERILGKDQAFHFNRSRALLFTHPEQEEPYDRSRHPLDHALAKAMPTSLPAQYSDIEVEEHETELDMIKGFPKLVKEWGCDILTGWNIEGFDIETLFLRYGFLQKKRLEKLRRINNIIVDGSGGGGGGGGDDDKDAQIRGRRRSKRNEAREPDNLPLSLRKYDGRGSWAYYLESGNASKGEKKVLSVKAPYINMVDGLNVWTDTQASDKPFTLDHQSERNLTYRQRIDEPINATRISSPSITENRAKKETESQKSGEEEEDFGDDHHNDDDDDDDDDVNTYQYSVNQSSEDVAWGIQKTRIRVPARFFRKTTYYDDKGKKEVPFPRRKLDVDVTKGGDYWRAGGKLLWFFLCYCYIDAALPVHLLEDKSKIDYMLAMSRITNLPFEKVFAGQQRKVFGNIAAVAKRFHLEELPEDDPAYGAPHLVPDYGRRHLHWPDAWLQATAEAAFFFAKTSDRFRKKPEKAKGYEGAYNFDPHRGVILDPIVIPDFTSLYPALMISYMLVFMAFLTSFTIKHYKLPRHVYSRVIIGAAEQIYCGEYVYDEQAANEEGYAKGDLKEAFWHLGVKHSVLSSGQKKLFKRRSLYKAEFARWKAYSRIFEFRDKFNELTSNDVASIVSFIDNEHWGNWFRKAFHTDKERNEMLQRAERIALSKPEEAIRLRELASLDRLTTWHSMVTEANAALPDWVSSNAAAIAYADSRASTFNASQLACKIILNSTYGATGVPIRMAILPLMEIAASITSKGRHCIQMTSYIFESQRVPELAERTQRWKQEGRQLSSIFEDMGNEAAEVACDNLLDPTSSEYRNVTCLEEHEGTKGNVQTNAGDTDSVMTSWPRQYLKKDTTVDDVMDQAFMTSALVNDVMLGVMNIDPEKMSRMTSFHVKKNYVMDIVGWKNLLHKGNAVVKAEHIGFVKRKIANLFQTLMRPNGGTSTTLDIEETDAIKQRLVHYLHDLRHELRGVSLGELDLSEFVIHKRLNKLDYASPPEHAVVAQLRNQRGDHVSAGDRISYGFINLDDAHRLRNKLKPSNLKNDDAMQVDQEEEEEEEEEEKKKNKKSEDEENGDEKRAEEKNEKDGQDELDNSSKEYNMETRSLKRSRADMESNTTTTTRAEDKPVNDGDSGSGSSNNTLEQNEAQIAHRKKILRTLGESTTLGRAFELVEDIQVIMSEQVPLNVEYYLERKMGGLLDPLAHMLAPVDNYPHESQQKYHFDEKQLEKDRKKVQQYQRDRVKRFLYAPAKNEFDKRRRLEYRRLKEQQDRQQGSSLQSFFQVISNTRESRQCAFCRSVYEVTVTPKERAHLQEERKTTAQTQQQQQHVCPSCLKNRGEHLGRMDSEIEEGHATLTRTEQICWSCIRNTDFDDIISPKDCRKYRCPVFEERAAATIRIQNAEKRGSLLRRHIDIEYSA